MVSHNNLPIIPYDTYIHDSCKKMALSLVIHSLQLFSFRLINSAPIFDATQGNSSAGETLNKSQVSTNQNRTEVHANNSYEISTYKRYAMTRYKNLQ